MLTHWSQAQASWNYEKKTGGQKYRWTLLLNNITFLLSPMHGYLLYNLDIINFLKNLCLVVKSETSNHTTEDVSLP